MADKKPPGFNPAQQTNSVAPVRVASPAPAKAQHAALRKKFPKLFGLRCWTLAQEKIKAGVALEEVARWIQEDMLEYGDSKRESLTRALYRFKSELPETDIVREKPTYVDEAVEKMRRGINELDELEKLYLLQLKRISLDASTEERINKLFKTTNREIELAQMILVRRMELKQKMGLVETVPQAIDVTQRSMNANVNISATDAPLDDERKMKLGVIAEKLISGLMKSSDTELKEAADSSPS